MYMNMHSLFNITRRYPDPFPVLYNRFSLLYSAKCKLMINRNTFPYSNSLFLFCGRRCDRIKALHFEKDGFCLYYKRLDNGRFQWPRDSSEVRNLSRQEYRWLLEGLSIDQPKAIRPARKKDF